MDPEQVRAHVLALPEVEQYDHGGCPAFRVRGRRFASMLDAQGVNVMLDEHQMRAALAEWPAWCRPERFGGRLAAVHILLEHADPTAVRELLTEAWRRRAPGAVVRRFDAAE